jgi:hypothetical protein
MVVYDDGQDKEPLGSFEKSRGLSPVPGLLSRPDIALAVEGT